jgi:hypothetical protein
MKALLITTMIIGGTLAASTGYSQVYVNARLGFRLPAPRGYYAPAPAPAVYDEYTPAPVAYDQEYAPAPVVVDDYPIEAYYGYPAWQGHYRDRFYFDHYRPFVARDRRYRDYFGRGRDFGRGHEYTRGHENGRGYDRGRESGHGSEHRRW